MFNHHDVLMRIRYSALKEGDAMSVRTTITLDEDILKLLKLKALETSESLSSLVNNIVIDALREDNMDLKAFEERKNEEILSFESFLKQLEANGKL
ncbi:hypothetical protein [Sulfuricurvum sp.]|uniref:hypothetical protein n=1 Tax=Sulfuricurvum sp. TaxID=2025608 RepID=UPI0025EBC9B1|nr:hypothetical protein [Sulfuricurvum sp.]